MKVSNITCSPQIRPLGSELIHKCRQTEGHESNGPFAT